MILGFWHHRRFIFMGKVDRYFIDLEDKDGGSRLSRFVRSIGLTLGKKGHTRLNGNGQCVTIYYCSLRAKKGKVTHSLICFQIKPFGAFKKKFPKLFFLWGPAPLGHLLNDHKSLGIGNNNGGGEGEGCRQNTMLQKKIGQPFLHWNKSIWNF